VTADRTAVSRPHRHRVLVAAAVLPLLALAACGYGSDSTSSKSGTAASTASAGGKKLSASEVKIGYFANLTHATPLVGLKEGLFQKELGSTKIKQSVFNAGPAEIEALNAGSIDIGWIGPSPAINGYVK
jgi:NitT/TauT family transport system substrate-binding protein